MAERAAHPIDHVFPAHADVGSLASTFELLRFVREGVAVGVAVHPLVAAVDASTDSTGTVSNNRVGVGIPFLVRWYPIRRATRRHGLEPYIGAGFGPLVGADVTMFSGGTTSDAGVKATVAGLAQVGIDFRVGRVVLGASGGYNWSGRVPNRDSSFTRYSGAEVSFGIGIVMGKPAIR